MKNKVLITILMALIAFSLMAGPGDPLPNPHTGTVATTTWEAGNIDVYLWEGEYHIRMDAWTTTDTPLEMGPHVIYRGLIIDVGEHSSYETFFDPVVNYHTYDISGTIEITEPGWYEFRAGAYANYNCTVNSNTGTLICDSYKVPQDPK